MSHTSEQRPVWNRSEARILAEMGYSLIPIEGKKPAERWKHNQCEPNTPMRVFLWKYWSAAVVTGAVSGIVVVDCDTRESARAWTDNPTTATPMRVGTKRGAHFYYRWQSNVRNMVGAEFEGGTCDIRGDGGYCLCPPTEGYEWLAGPCKPTDLPFFRPSWLIERCRTSLELNAKGFENSRAPIDSRHQRVWKYISKIQAISGSGGSRETVRVCCHLVRSGISPHDALAMLHAWNKNNAKPTWSSKELARRMQWALDNTRENQLEQHNAEEILW